MRKLVILLVGLFIFSTAFSQDEAKTFIQEGIELHDKGDFEGAIAKYDAALKLEPSNGKAMYEKSYSLMQLKKYAEAAEILKVILKESKEPEYRKLSYVNYGTVLDYMGDKSKSIEVYDKGMKEFPTFYLLPFNKGITQSGMNNAEGAIESFQRSVTLNPMHASSHNALGRAYFEAKRIPATLALFTFLVIEPNGKRAEQNLDYFNQLMTRGVSKGENGNVTINISMDMLDDSKKSKQDDFSGAELVLSLMGSSNELADTLGAKTEADRLDIKMQMLINAISDVKKKEKGFIKNFYVPMFVEMKKKNYVKTACYIAMASTNDKVILQWIDENSDAVNEFYDWFKSYFKWKKA